ncbi:hypothetical protein BV25DRAFT_915422 [Artomyces pyxidatus]|uniref:Uncharacterized protein n=1 Tax=Artomyces pyxidatus TaxID=48021 RepID=A0ACB8SYE1_9AGAM|nr:hypothetical protein BV25DRAFT_915422 [Artomyces pyxidatus]
MRGCVQDCTSAEPPRSLFRSASIILLRMNYTLDDASAYIFYSPNWEVQGNDPDVASFFQSTYHAALADGASLNFTFLGSAIYMYGSRGPQHAQYSVNCDGVVANMTANTSQMGFQQLLYSRDSLNDSAPHTVSIVVRTAKEKNWFDLDYVTFSQGSSLLLNASPTLNPPWATDTGTSEPEMFTSQARESTNPSATIAASILGVLLGIVLATVAIVLVMRHRSAQRAQWEHKFRHGEAVVSQDEPLGTTLGGSRWWVVPHPLKGLQHMPFGASSASGLGRTESDESGTTIPVRQVSHVPLSAGGASHPPTERRVLFGLLPNSLTRTQRPESTMSMRTNFLIV